MTTYLVADGHDVPEGSMTALDPQPRSRGIQYTRQTFAADGTPVNEGPFVELVYNVVGSKSQYQSILTDFGLLAADSNAVTVKVRDEEFDFVRKNGLAIKPLPGTGVDWSNYFPRNVVILVRDLEDAA